MSAVANRRFRGARLRHGYNDLGIQAVLKETGMPKGSFYHHFASKEDFALQVVERYMDEVHNGLDESLGDRSLAPLDRVRKFFESTRDKYREDGYLGCMLGGLGHMRCEKCGRRYYLDAAFVNLTAAERMKLRSAPA